MAATYFRSARDFRKWLAAHHATEKELLVGFHKKGTGQPSMTWPQSVDEALCFGWIDGVRKRVDETRYTIRFTPRRKRSIWSAMSPPYEKALRRNKAAAAFFDAQPPSYRKLAAWWVMSAKKEETRQKRRAKLIADSSARKRI